MNYKIDFNSKKPIYLQLYEQVRKDIIDGVYPYKSKLPSKSWRDCGMDVERGAKPGAFQYRVEAFCADGKWKTVVDASQNRRDLLVDYRETEPVKASAARLVVLGAPKGIVPGVVDFSPFGD